MLVDQKMNDGIEARLFGLPAMTAPAAAAFALRFRCPVIPGHSERIGPARFRLVCDPPLNLPDTGDRTADLAALTQAINDRLEAWIRARPEQWLWLHRRWPAGTGR
jgi:KDO2-lipid IV(A) lauroyltransferase